jgi:hypothetical protein
MNTHIRDNFSYIKGVCGVVTFEDVITSCSAGATIFETASFGARFAADKYLSYGDTYYPVVTCEGTQRVVRFGSVGVSWDGGGLATNTKVYTGLNTIDAVVFSVCAPAGISNKKLATGTSAGSVTFRSIKTDVGTGTIFWMAAGS